METTSSDTKNTQRKSWIYWFYNTLGKLIEFRSGSGPELQNHESNFSYDDKGRLSSFEYRQGADDKLFRRTAISYSNNGKTIEMTNRFPGSKFVDRSTRFLDDQNRVVRVFLSTEGRAADDEAKNIRFRYDEKGRLVEQTTDAKKLSDASAEQDLPPGAISIVYDDTKHTKTTSHSFPGEGTMRIVVTRDESGATMSYSLDGPSMQVGWRFECDYDNHHNWTSCSQIGVEEGKQFVEHRFRRTITYRAGGG